MSSHSFFTNFFIIARVIINPAIHTLIGQFSITYPPTYMFLNGGRNPDEAYIDTGTTCTETSHSHPSSGSNPGTWICEAAMPSTVPPFYYDWNHGMVFRHQDHKLTIPPAQSCKRVSCSFTNETWPSDISCLLPPLFIMERLNILYVLDRHARNKTQFTAWSSILSNNIPVMQRYDGAFWDLWHRPVS